MKSFSRFAILGAALGGLLFMGTGSGPLRAQEKALAKGNGWTLDEALEQLRLYPQDAYLQYVALQLARRENRVNEVGQQVERLVNPTSDDFGGPGGPNGRANRVDLFNLFSGALAVQESLQLDTMRGQRAGRSPRFDQGPPTTKKEPEPEPKMEDKGAAPEQKAPAPQGERPKGKRLSRAMQKLAKALPKVDAVPVSSLSGPTIKSHPWKEMLAGKTPDVGRMGKCVPEDNYLIEFHSLVKMLDVMDRSDLWGTHLFNQSVQEARTQLVGERLKKQLAVETSTLLRPFYDAVVEEVAVTGSDLFLREGSDVTLLFRSKQPLVLKARMDGFLANAEKMGAKRSEGTVQGLAFTHVETPDRSVHVFSAYPTPDLHVRSNSHVGLERVIAAIQGKDAAGKAVRRLGDTDEFAYVRTLMPRGAKEEDGFVYLSDPFIRKLVGPAVKLTERRRVLCYNHLRMIGHAALMYRTESGRPPTSLDELFKAGCAPGLFGQGELTCPGGGKYVLSADGMSGVCSHHGHTHGLNPCCEMAVQHVSTEEAGEYKEFLEEYNRYWRTFFDPIALRIQATPQRYRIETIVLPLIDNSVYTAMAKALAGKPEPLDPLPVAKRNIFSLAVRFDKRELLRSADMEELLTQKEEPPPTNAKRPPPGDERRLSAENLRAVNNLKQIGLAMHNFHDVQQRFPAMRGGADGKGKLSWRVYLLPYLEQEKLYQQFRLDEPWDSEHNKSLIAQMPDVYRPRHLGLAREGKTWFVGLVGKDTMFRPDGPGVQIREIMDGTSNTILVTEADEAHAVVWTKPDDLPFDPNNPTNGLEVWPHGLTQILLADGSVQSMKPNPAVIGAMATKAGREPMDRDQQDSRPTRRPFGVADDLVRRLKLGEVIAKGLGNQVGLHVCDAEPMIDFSLPQFFGMAIGTFNGRGPLGSEGVMIGFFAAALTAPVYVSLPVQDAKIVDDFLARLDGFLAEVAREKEPFGRFFRVDQDYYQFPGGKGKDLRAYGVRFGPLKWRFFWGRIGEGLYVASKPFILEDLLAADAAKDRIAADHGPTAHGMVRLRPQNWQRVLSDYRLGWAENNREACLHNLGPLTSLSRSLAGTPEAERKKELERLSGEIYGVRFFCPEEGHYHWAAEGKSVTCSVHGSAQAPRQPAAPVENSQLGKLLKEFSDMTLALTFLEDGLHAVATMERR